MQNDRRHSALFKQVNLEEMVACLEDLINYFAQPEDDIGMYSLRSVSVDGDTPLADCSFHVQSTKRDKLNFEPCAIDRTCSKRRAYLT